MDKLTVKWAVILRKSLQLIIILVLFLSPLLQVVRTLRQDPYPYMESPVSQNMVIQNFLLEVDHDIRNVLDPVYSNFSGGPYAINIFGIHFEEPLTVLVNFFYRIADPSSMTAVFLVTVSLAFGLALMFGRVYCGYICPMSVFTSANIKFQSRFFKRGPSFSYSGELQKDKSWWHRFYLIGLFVLVFSHPVIIQFILPSALLQHGVSDWVLFGGSSLWLVLLFAVIIFEFILPGYFCRKLCPTGQMLSVVGHVSPFRIQFDKKIKCEAHCKLCLDDCWLGLSPKSYGNSSSCDLCHRCVEACPVSRLSLSKKGKYND